MSRAETEVLPAARSCVVFFYLSILRPGLISVLYCIQHVQADAMSGEESLVGEAEGRPPRGDNYL